MKELPIPRLKAVGIYPAAPGYTCHKEIGEKRLDNRTMMKKQEEYLCIVPKFINTVEYTTGNLDLVFWLNCTR